MGGSPASDIGCKSAHLCETALGGQSEKLNLNKTGDVWHFLGHCDFFKGTLLAFIWNRLLKFASL